MADRRGPHELVETLPTAPRSVDRQQALWLLVVTETGVTSHALPASGEVTIGRADSCTIRVDHPSISRNHAVLHTGTPVRITDLGSQNGTAIGGVRIASGASADLAPGDVIDIGTAKLILQQGPATTKPRRIWSHDYFEGRLEDECSRGGEAHSHFAIVRVRVDQGVAADVIESSLAADARPGDVIAAYAPGEYELLFVDATRDKAAQRLARVHERLSGSGSVHVAVACFPEDGRDADTLIAEVYRQLQSARTSAGDGGPVIAAVGPMRELVELVERVATSSISVLLLGETGVGKEVFAEHLHRLSPRAARPLLRLNCGALTESLLESELFGHEKGAFTGAVQAKPGLLETADGGTVFLDEIGEMPGSVQVKLLRVLEDRKVTRVGGVKARSIDVRFVSATNRDLDAEIERGSFRPDLYYRLNGVALVIPPLRERVSEIAGLAAMFIARTCEREGRTTRPALSSDALAILEAYQWPGNIRELRNVIERAVVLCRGAMIEPAQLPLAKMQARITQAPAAVAKLPDELERLEKTRIMAALEQCNGNQTQAAKLLGMPRRTLVARLTAWGFTRPRRL